MSSQPLPGFRDFFPDDCARRNYLFAMWREVARRYGFVEYDGPTVEPLSLYEKKSGGELVGQLFTVGTRAELTGAEERKFVRRTNDNGTTNVEFGDGQTGARLPTDRENVTETHRKGALRPEMTPTLARMVAARERDFKKPLKWFCMPSFFRHERQQRGRLREFYQLNCDIIGEKSDGADGELIALVVDLMRQLGFTKNDFVVRVSDRAVWRHFSYLHNIPAERELELLAVIDKLDRLSKTDGERQFKEFGVTLEEVETFFMSGGDPIVFTSLWDEFRARGLEEFVDTDLSIVRGLAYYTGIVFEVFDRSKKERAIAGGGRYDKLLSLMSDGKVDLPALGFGMGDVVLGNMIDDTPHAAEKMRAWIAKHHAADVYVIIAKEERRADALALVQQLRDAGYRVDFPLAPAKVGKQFQAAEHLGARLAVLLGDEWPQVKIKTFATREEVLVAHDQLLEKIAPSFAPRHQD